MKIATNKLSSLYQFYKDELIAMYDEAELYAIFELICEYYLNYSKTDVRFNFEENLNQSDVLKIYDAAKALRTGVPIQYILGEAYFYNLRFNVNSSTLIPRPETEELVDLIIKDQSTNNINSILDIGTGSGCIPITLKKNIPNTKVTGLDISDKALKTATENALKNNVDVEFIKLDILQETSFNNEKMFSVIVSNPPYILKSEANQMTEHVLAHEPHLALFVDDNDGIVFYKRIIDVCKQALKPEGHLYFELNPLTAGNVEQYAKQSNLFSFVSIINDMSGKQRFLKAQKI